MAIDHNTLGKDAYRNAAPGDNFFGIPHTLANFETANYRSDLADTNSFEQWQEDGSKTIDQRANQRWKEMLAQYEMPPMDAAVDEALLEFMEKKKSGVADRWY